MFTLTVTPISRGTAAGELTYFSAIEYPRGAVVMVPMRNREVPALVLGAAPVRESKAKVRAGGYALRKVKRQQVRTLVTPEFIRAAQKTARYYAATTGAVLFSHLPKALMDLPTVPSLPKDTARPRLRGFVVPRLYQDLFEGRQDFYRTTVRESFAARGSVFIVVPTIADAERVYDAQRGGIEQYAHLVHGNLSQKVQRERIHKILTAAHPVLIVAPITFLAIPRHDLVSILVEREGSSLYRARTRPFVDACIYSFNRFQYFQR